MPIPRTSSNSCGVPERLVCEAKDGFASDEFSSRNWNANCAGRLLKPLACNLTLAFQRDRSAIRGEQLQTVRLPRRSILCIPGSVVRLARGWTLRLARCDRPDGQCAGM